MTKCIGQINIISKDLLSIDHLPRPILQHCHLRGELFTWWTIHMVSCSHYMFIWQLGHGFHLPATDVCIYQYMYIGKSLIEYTHLDLTAIILCGCLTVCGICFWEIMTINLIIPHVDFMWCYVLCTPGNVETVCFALHAGNILIGKLGQYWIYIAGHPVDIPYIKAH